MGHNLVLQSSLPSIEQIENELKDIPGLSVHQSTKSPRKQEDAVVRNFRITAEGRSDEEEP